MSDVILEASSENVDRRGVSAALKAASGNLNKVSIPRAAVTPTFTREDAVALKKQTERAARKQLRDAPADVFDWREHWQGMPSFSMSGDTPPCKKINVLFASWEDVKVFSKLINQTMTTKTK